MFKTLGRVELLCRKAPNQSMCFGWFGVDMDSKEGLSVVNFHFISGLPRAGSTLFAGILAQHPDFHAAMSSPVAGLMNSLLEQTGASSEFYQFFDSEKRKSLCRSLFHTYYEDKTDTRVIFDTNRQWTARLHQLVELFDDFKVICCVRNPAWVVDSFERIYRKNPFDYSRMYSPATRLTVYSRCESLIQPNSVIGSAWCSLKEAYYGEYSDRLLLIDYDLLAQHPAQTLHLVYQFLNEPEFDHDFNHVEYQEEAFDSALGVKDLHTVRRQVQYMPRRSILPPDLFQKYAEMAFWKDSSGTSAHYIAPRAVKGE